jgi:hypothetical protein
MSPEQMFDSLALAVGYQAPPVPKQPRGYGPGDPARDQFIRLFAGGSENSTEQQTSILQALALMNGKIVADATSLDQSRVLQQIAFNPFLTFEEQIEALFLRTLSRKPSKVELDRLARHVAAGAARAEQGRALADVFWVLLNSSEFMLNH